MPNTCPVCGADAIREEGESAVRCIGIECPAKQYRNIIPSNLKCYIFKQCFFLFWRIFISNCPFRCFIICSYLKIGDTVIIQKAGDVIPEVVRVVKEKRTGTGTEKQISMPNKCPVCGADAIREEGESAVRCIGIGFL